MNISDKNNRINFLVKQLDLLKKVDLEIVPDKDKKIKVLSKELEKLRKAISIISITNDFKNRTNNGRFYTLGSDFSTDVKEEFIEKKTELIDNAIKLKWKEVQKLFSIKGSLEITDKVRLSFLQSK